MNKYIKTTIIGIVTLAMFGCSGCASYMVYKNSEHKVAVRKAMAKGDAAAIKAINMGDGAVGIGIDVSNWEALSEQPLLQLGGALIDAAAIYGGYKGIESLNNGSSSHKTQINVSGDHNNTTVVDGEGNTTTTSTQQESTNN